MWEVKREQGQWIKELIRDEVCKNNAWIEEIRTLKVSDYILDIVGSLLKHDYLF